MMTMVIMMMMMTKNQRQEIFEFMLQLAEAG